jgi:hypothetical protein
MGRGATAPALIEQQDTIAGGVEEAAMTGLATSARAAMQKNGGDTVRIPALLYVQLMDLIHSDAVCGIRLDRGIKVGFEFHLREDTDRETGSQSNIGLFLHETRKWITRVTMFLCHY